MTISSDEDSLQDESGSNSEAECNWISEEENVSRVGTFALEQESGERATNTLQEVEDKLVTDTPESDNPDDWLNLDRRKLSKEGI